MALTTEKISTIIIGLTIVTVLCGLGIAVLQRKKDKIERDEELMKEKEINRVNILLQQKSDSIEVKSDKIIGLQSIIGKENEQLIARQQEVIQMQNTLNEYVTGGDIAPTIEVLLHRRVLSPAGGYSLAFVLANNGHIPLGNVRLDYLDRSGEVDSENFKKNNALILGSLFREQNPVSFASLPPGYRKRFYHIIMSSREIQQPLTKFDFDFDVIYNANFYNINAQFKIIDGVVSEEKITYSRNNKPIVPNEYIKLKFTRDWGPPQ